MRLYYILALLLVLSSCKKSEIDLITNNEPPPDNTISDVTIENYVTRTYILVLGREPDSSEFTNAHDLLSDNHIDSTSRKIFLDSVFSDPDYRPHVYDENRIDLLNNLDTAEISNWIYIFNLFLTDTTYQLQWPYFQYEADRLTSLRNAFPQYVGDTIEVEEVQRRMCNNYFYDQINMGSANFVTATFQHLINRNPITAEQNAGVSMVDGNNAVLFLQSGNSKDDFLTIFTQSQSYYEGQVILFYLKYLNRNPTSVEMSDGTLKYSSMVDATLVQRDILSTDEFIGL